MWKRSSTEPWLRRKVFLQSIAKYSTVIALILYPDNRRSNPKIYVLGLGLELGVVNWRSLIYAGNINVLRNQ